METTVFLYDLIRDNYSILTEYLKTTDQTLQLTLARLFIYPMAFTLALCSVSCLIKCAEIIRFSLYYPRRLNAKSTFGEMSPAYIFFFGGTAFPLGMLIFLLTGNTYSNNIVFSLGITILLHLLIYVCEYIRRTRGQKYERIKSESYTG